MPSTRWPGALNITAAFGGDGSWQTSSTSFDVAEDPPSVGWLDEQFAVLGWRVNGGKRVVIKMHVNLLRQIPQVVEHGLQQHKQIYELR